MPDGAAHPAYGLQDVHVATSQEGRPVAFRPLHVITTQLDRAIGLVNDLHSQRAGAASLPPLQYRAIDAPASGGDNLTDQDADAAVDAEDPYGVARTWTDGTDLSGSESPFYLLENVLDPEATVEHLRRNGIAAHLNHTYFSHAGASYPHAAIHDGADLMADPVYAHPVYANPVYASPVAANPVYAHPVYAHSVYASPLQATDAAVPASSAVPAQSGRTTEGIVALLQREVVDGARVIVLDTGLSDPSKMTAQLGPLFGRPHPIRPLRASDASDVPGQHGLALAPAAGHGTFIAGVVNQAAPGCRVFVGKVLNGLGVGDEWTIARRIHGLTSQLKKSPEAGSSILSLSFGSPTLDHPQLLAHVIREIQALGVVVVASAGNDAMDTPVYPAALPGVIGVGALGPSGPAPFSNHGSWVNACAAGVDLVSAFFNCDEYRPLDFKGWAIWSGTSFSCPIVAGALAKTILTSAMVYGRPISAEQARTRLIDSPWLMRVPDLGTVVNVF
jgi:hypothetical protein